MKINASKIRKAKLKEDGICTCCGCNIVCYKTFNCEDCLIKKITRNAFYSTSMWKEIKIKLIGQFYRCYYTGIILAVGVNASLDHKLPKSKYKELSMDINNMVWCDYHVNMLKSNMTEEEFYVFLKNLYKCNKDELSACAYNKNIIYDKEGVEYVIK